MRKTTVFLTSLKRICCAVQGIESDHYRVKRPLPRVGGFHSFNTARRTIQDFEAMLWLRKGLGFAGVWTRP